MDLGRLRTALNGVLAFTPTFLRTDTELDLDALAGHVDHLAGSGVCGVVVAGGVGEFYALTDRELRDLVAAAVGAAGGRVPILAGVGHDTARAARQAQLAAEAGASGLMVNPFYFIRPEPAGAIEHCRRLGKASGLGMMMFSTRDAVYDAPALEALSEVDTVVAVKDEYGDPELFSECIRRLGDRFVWINGMAEGPAMEYAARGAVVMTSGIVNLDPALAIDIWDAAVRADRATYDRLMSERVAPIAALRSARPGYHITVLKEALSLLGRGTPTARLPLIPLRPGERAALGEHLRAAGFPALAAT